MFQSKLLSLLFFFSLLSTSSLYQPYILQMTLIHTHNLIRSPLVLTSTQSSLWVEDVPSKSDSLGHHLPIKSHFFSVVQGVTHQCGAKDVLHGLTQVSFIAHQGQSCVDVVRSNLTEEGKRTESSKRLRHVSRSDD